MFVLGGVVVSVGVILLVFGDDIKISYEVIECVGCVVVMLGICINEYVFCWVVVGCVIDYVLVVIE